ncbi:MAG: YvrJ family protein [Clostridiaceae bacterium]
MDMVNLIGNVGFPIAVSLYLLVRIEGKLENLTNSINELTNVMTKLEKEDLKSVR